MLEMKSYKRTYAEDWSAEIEEIETLLSSMQLPEGSLQLTAGEIVTDIKAFVSSHLSMVKANNGNPVFRPYLERLVSAVGMVNSQIE